MIRERRVLAFCLTAVLAVAACGGSATANPTAAPTSAGASATPAAAAATPVTGTIKLGFTSSPDSSHMPTLLAVDELNKVGWHATTTFFTTPEVAFGALAAGDVDIVDGATTAALSAIQAGAKIHVIGLESLIAWDVVATNALTKCDDLVGKRWGLNSPGGVTTALADYWIQNNCSAASQTAIKPIYISGSEVRASAMVAGQLDATMETPLDDVNINTQAPGKFHVLVNFAADPTLKGYLSTTFVVNDAFATAHPEVVVAFLKGLIKGYKDAQANPSLMAAPAKENNITYDAPTQAAIVLEFQQGIYDPTLAFTDAAMNFTIQFGVKYGGIALGLSAAQVDNTSFLQQASTP